MRIVKFNVGNIYDKDVGYRPVAGDAVLLNVFPRDTFPCGNVALALKKGKKRILVKGFVEAVPNSSPEFGLTWEWYFKPKNENQLEKLKKSLKLNEKTLIFAHY
jgi:hypothetical protein